MSKSETEKIELRLKDIQEKIPNLTGTQLLNNAILLGMGSITDETLSTDEYVSLIIKIYASLPKENSNTRMSYMRFPGHVTIFSPPQE